MSPRYKICFSIFFVFLVSAIYAADVLSVKFLTERRMELHATVILVEGIVQETITGEKACPTCPPCPAGDPCKPCALGCAQPRIFLSDTAEPEYPRLMVLLREGDEAYSVGQQVVITGKVEASPVAVYLEKFYE